MSNRLRRFAVLALLRAFADQMLDGGMSPGRIKNLYNKLQAEVDKILRTMPKPTLLETSELSKKLTEWATKTKWLKRAKAPATVAVFLIGLIVDHIPKHDKILEIVEDIYWYYARSVSSLAACDCGGSLSSERFSEIFGYPEEVKD